MWVSIKNQKHDNWILTPEQIVQISVEQTKCLTLAREFAVMYLTILCKNTDKPIREMFKTIEILRFVVNADQSRNLDNDFTFTIIHNGIMSTDYNSDQWKAAHNTLKMYETDKNEHNQILCINYIEYYITRLFEMPLPFLEARYFRFEASHRCVQPRKDAIFKMVTSYNKFAKNNKLAAEMYYKCVDFIVNKCGFKRRFHSAKNNYASSNTTIKVF